MKDAFEWKGYWWLPGNEENRLSGTLSYSQEAGAYLELLGNFETRLSNEMSTAMIILGEVQTGKYVTLFNCLYVNRSLAFSSGLGQAEYHVHFVFEGVHFESEADIKFHQLCGHYTDLDAWINIFGFTIERDQLGNPYNASISYNKPNNQFFAIGNNFEVGIGFATYGPDKAIVQTEVIIRQRAFLIVKSRIGDRSFDEILSKLNAYSDLFQVAAQKIQYPVSIFGFTEMAAIKHEGEETVYPEINIYYQPIEAITHREPLLPHDMLFTYGDLEPAQIVAWFTSFERYQTVIHLYRTLFYNNRLFIETRFLNIAQALESLHSILFDNLYMPKDVFIIDRERVLANVPDDLRDWVDSALNNANYKRFRLKIFELLENKSDLFHELIKDFDLFAKQIMHTRNEYVHNSKQKHTFRGGKELYNAINLMTMVFEAYILEIIGFSAEKIKELLEPKIKTYLTGWKHLRQIKK